MAEAMDVEAAPVAVPEQDQQPMETQGKQEQAAEQELPFSEEELAVCYKVNTRSIDRSIDRLTLGGRYRD